MSLWPTDDDAKLSLALQFLMDFRQLKNCYLIFAKWEIRRQAKRVHVPHICPFRAIRQKI